MGSEMCIRDRPEAAPLVNLKIGNRASQTVAIEEALSILNLTWGSVQPPSVEALPSRGIIEATMIPWDMLEEADHPGAVRSTLSQLLIDISGTGISAYTIASLLAGLADQQFSARSIRKIGAAIAAAARSASSRFACVSSPSSTFSIFAPAKGQAPSGVS